MTGLARPKAVAFDIIETVFRIEPLGERLDALGLPPGSLQLVYASALRDAMAMACVNSFAPFMEVMKGAIRQVAGAAGEDLPDARLTETLAVMRELPAHPDAREAFDTLRDAGIRILALSNGAAASTKALLERADLAGHVAHVLSVEGVRLSKPRPEVYLQAVEAASLRPAEITMVACHPWDLHGAKATGLGTAYVDRNRPYPANLVPPDLRAGSLREVARALAALPG